MSEILLPNKRRQIYVDGFIMSTGRYKVFPFLWDTGASITTIAWSDLRDLGLSENEILNTEKIPLGITASGDVLLGYIVKLPMLVIRPPSKKTQILGLKDVNVRTSNTVNMQRLLGTDIISLMNSYWNSIEEYVQVEARRDLAEELNRRATSLEKRDTYWTGTSILSLSDNYATV